MNKIMGFLIVGLLMCSPVFASGGWNNPQAKCTATEESKCPGAPKSWSDYAGLSESTKECMKKAQDKCRCEYLGNKKPPIGTGTYVERYNKYSCAEFGMPDKK